MPYRLTGRMTDSESVDTGSNPVRAANGFETKVFEVSRRKREFSR